MEIKLDFEITETEYHLMDEVGGDMLSDKAKNEWIRVVGNEEVRVEDWTLVHDNALLGGIMSRKRGKDRYYLEVWIDVDVQDLWKAAQEMRTRLSEYES